MTRINCVDPSELTDAHLAAEYRELPRIFGAVRKAIAKGQKPSDKRFPNEYRLGAGHVLFFYPRLGYLVQRYKLIVAECRRRGRTVNFPELPTQEIPPEWFGEWQPTADAIALNRQRILERLG